MVGRDLREFLIKGRGRLVFGGTVEAKEVGERVEVRPELGGGQFAATLDGNEVGNDSTPTHLTDSNKEQGGVWLVSVNANERVPCEGK